jgi:hypothetical protein
MKPLNRYSILTADKPETPEILQCEKHGDYEAKFRYI